MNSTMGGGGVVIIVMEGLVHGASAVRAPSSSRGTSLWPEDRAAPTDGSVCLPPTTAATLERGAKKTSAGGRHEGSRGGRGGGGNRGGWNGQTGEERWSGRSLCTGLGRPTTRFRGQWRSRRSTPALPHLQERHNVGGPAGRWCPGRYFGSGTQAGGSTAPGLRHVRLPSQAALGPRMNTHLRRSKAQGERAAATSASTSVRNALMQMPFATSDAPGATAASYTAALGADRAAGADRGAGADRAAGAGGAAGAVGASRAAGASEAAEAAGAAGAADAAVVAGAAGAAGVTVAAVASDSDMAAGASGAAGKAGDARTAGFHRDSRVDELSAAAEAAIDPEKEIEKAVLQEMVALMAIYRWEAGAAVVEDSQPGHHRRGLAAGAPVDDEYTYTTVSTAVRALHEDERDWARAEPLDTRRKGWRAGRSDSFRLRAVERFAITCDGGGHSHDGIEKLWDLLETGVGTRPGMPMDGGHHDCLRDSFRSVNAFKDAIHEDVDDAALGEGWKKCRLRVDGQHVDVLFRPVLEVVLAMLKKGKKVRLWSGDAGPAPPSNIRESPLYADAFRLKEAALMQEKDDTSCFVLGLHVFSDASHLSMSGGTFQRANLSGSG